MVMTMLQLAKRSNLSRPRKKDEMLKHVTLSTLREGSRGARLYALVPQKDCNKSASRTVYYKSIALYISLPCYLKIRK